MDKPTFEESIDKINVEIHKRKAKWNLTALAWIDYEDVSQILRIHIFKKWHLYDPARPLGPWVNRVISSQLKNLIRNLYSNYSRPCLRCAAFEGDDLCSIYTKQCADCPLYAQWEKTKKRAYDTKLAVSLENHVQEVYNQPQDTIDIEKSTNNLNAVMQENLSPVEWQIYKALYIDHLEEAEVIVMMGYKYNNKNTGPGYKAIRNFKKSILLKAKRYLNAGEVDIV